MDYPHITPIAALSRFEFNPLYHPMNNRKMLMPTRKERYTLARYFPQPDFHNTGNALFRIDKGIPKHANATRLNPFG